MRRRCQLVAVLWLLVFSRRRICAKFRLFLARGRNRRLRRGHRRRAGGFENKATGFSISGQTDSLGEYRFHQIPCGEYTISVAAKGFAAQSKIAELLVNQPATVSFSLSVQAQTTVVKVNSETTGLNQVDASMGDAVNDATIQSLPMEGRNVPDLLSLQPGVLYLGYGNDQSYDSRSGTSSGGRSDQGNLTLDGVDNNDQADGYAFTGVLRSTLDSVEEFRVTTAALAPTAADRRARR